MHFSEGGVLERAAITWRGVGGAVVRAMDTMSTDVTTADNANTDASNVNCQPSTLPG